MEFRQGQVGRSYYSQPPVIHVKQRLILLIQTRGLTTHIYKLKTRVYTAADSVWFRKRLVRLVPVIHVKQRLILLIQTRGLTTHIYKLKTRVYTAADSVWFRKRLVRASEYLQYEIEMNCLCANIPCKNPRGLRWKQTLPYVWWKNGCTTLFNKNVNTA